MKKAKLLVIVGLLVLISSAAWAQQSSKFKIMPLVGYRTSGGFDIESDELAYSNIRFNGGFAYGLSAGYEMNDFFTLEARWSRTSSTVEGFTPGPTPMNENLFNVSEDQLHANILIYLYEIGIARAYLTAGLGITFVNPGNGLESLTRFSWGVGTGFETMFKKNIGFRFQWKIFPTYLKTSEEILYEWVGGYHAIPRRDTMTQWEFTGGLIIRL